MNEIKTDLGVMRVHDHCETFGIWMTYKSLDLETGRSELLSFSCETQSLDAARALKFAMEVFGESESGMRPNCKVWDVEVHVNVLGDVLRQKLDSTVVNGSKIG